MPAKAQVPEVVHEFRRRLEALYGERLRDVILYGSYARGEADDGSDIDVLVVLDDFGDRRAERKRIERIACELSFEHELLLAATVARDEEYRRRRSPLLLNVRREGVPV